MRGRALRNQFLTKLFRNRMRVILSLLFCFLVSFQVSAQGLEYAVANDDPLQARIWHRALNWIYEDNNRTMPEKQRFTVPKVSDINLKKFETDLKNASAKNQDGYNFYPKLFLPVAQRLYKSSSELVNSEMLIKEIVKEAGVKPGRDTVKLKEALITFVSKTEPKPEEVASAQTQTVQEPVNTQVAPPVVDTAAAKETNKSVPFDFDTPMVLSLLALALAAWALLRTFGRKPEAAIAASRNYSTSTGAEINAPANSKNLNAIHKDLKTLRDEIIRLKKENERLLNKMAGEIEEVRNSVSANQMQALNSYQNQPQNATQFQEPTYQQPAPQNQLQDLSQPAGYAQPTFEIED